MSAGILYLHGFRSSPASLKASQLAEHMTARGLGERFFCPALSHVPEQAIDQAESILARAEGPLMLVGSSLGGYYATWLAEKHDLRAALINPAVLAPLSLSEYIGTQSNLYTGEQFELTTAHITQLQGMEVAQTTPARYLLLVETGDELLDYRQAVARYAGCRQIVLAGGNHSFTRFAEFMPQLLEFGGL